MPNATAAAQAFGQLGFALITIVSGCAFAPRDVPNTALRLALGIAFLIGCAFSVAWLGFVSGLPIAGNAIAVASVVATVVVLRRRTILDSLKQQQVRHTIGCWLIFALWSLLLLALVRSYSGGGWSVDWVEHWQRAEFFFERQPLDTKFGAIYSLTARPPLANLLTAIWFVFTGHSFAGYQVFLTLFGTLVCLPVLALFEHWTARPRASIWAVLLLLVNPMVAQNVTFAWTKLPTALFVLTAVAVALANGRHPTRHAAGFIAICFGFGLLTHYSAAPWIVATALALCWANRGSAWRAHWRRVGSAVALFLVVITPWFAWSALHFGVSGATQANTTATAWSAQTWPQRATVALENLRDTLIPFPLRGEPGDLIQQSNPIGRARDVAFNLYQTNLPLAFGAGGLVVLGFAVARRRTTAAPPATEVSFLRALIPSAVVLGVFVHTPRDAWGLAHICLQPLVLMGLAWSAAFLSTAPPALRRMWSALAVCDLAFGVALQFACESWALARSAGGKVDIPAFVASLNQTAVASANDKWAFHFEFFADRLAIMPELIAVALLVVLVFTADRAAKALRA